MDRPYLKILLLTGLIAVCFRLSVDSQEQPEIIRAWQLRDLLTEKEAVEIDTMINSFHINNPLFKKSISYSYLGNVGLAGISNIFADRSNPSDFFFIDPFRHYLNNASETRFYNTRRPFSLIDYSSGGPRGKNEKILNLLHTQNIDPDFNAGFSYFNINSDGQYQNQEAITNAISFFSSYVVDNYQAHASINLNSARVFESGGLADDESLRNPDYETEDHPVNLQDARHWLNNLSILVSQSWQPLLDMESDTAAGNFGMWLQGFRIFHVMQYDRYKRTYDDNNPTSGFYPDVLLNSNRTFDSVYFRSMTNSLMIQLPEFRKGSVSFNARAGLKNELLKASYNRLSDTVFHFSDLHPVHYFLSEPDDYLINDRTENNYGSNALIASARGNIGDVFGIWGEGNLFLQGHRAGEYDIRAGIIFDFFEGKNRSVIEAGINQSETTPSIFLGRYSSNHFFWENDFRKPGRSGLRGLISMPERNFSVSADFILLNNYIYFDKTANPRQHTDVFPVLNISLKKDVNLWRFFFRNIVNYQVTGMDNILPLPEISIYQSTWFEQTLIRDILNMQIGFDVYYYTAHSGYAYQPATAQFYLQDERSLGNYPYVDVFINFKHKRTRVFLKGEHVNAGFLEPEYFTVLHYPVNHRVIKFGFSWSFYN